MLRNAKELLGTLRNTKECKEFIFSSNQQNHFSAQLWKFNSEGNLVNRLRRWQHSDELSVFNPIDKQEGYIEVTSINKVLTYNNGNVGFKTKETPITAKQKWFLGPKDVDGWRTIKHSESGKYLTTLYIHPISVLAVEDKGRYHQFLAARHNLWQL